MLVGEPEHAALVAADEGLERVPIAPPRCARQLFGRGDRRQRGSQGAKRPMLLHSPWNYTPKRAPVARLAVKAL